MEIIPGYRRLLRVVKNHGMTEYGVPPHSNPQSLSVEEFLVCPEVGWSDKRGLSGHLRLTATPSEFSLGLIQLTMTMSRIPGNPDTRVYFEINPGGISARRQQYNSRFKDWIDLSPPVTGIDYEDHLMHTADILDRKFAK